MYKYLRSSCIALLATGLLFAPVATVPVEAISLGSILQGAIGVVGTRQAISDIDNNGQEEVLENTIKQVGYYDNPVYQARAKRILDDLLATGVPQRNYVIFVNPDENINAFCTLAGVLSINKGTLDTLDDDQIAFVLAHELSHGEHRDVVNGVTKSTALAAAAGAVAGDSGGMTAIAAQVAVNYVNNEVFTMSQERRADELGFEILSRSSYNLGAAAAAMHVLREYSGDHYRDGIERIVAPNSHPRTADRVTAGLDRLTKYSNGKVRVQESTVLLNDLPVVTAREAGKLDGFTRACYVAGKLARLAAADRLGQATLQGNAVYMQNVPLYTVAAGEDGTAMVTALNAAVAQKATAKTEKKEETPAPATPAAKSEKDETKSGSSGRITLLGRTGE
ncbi:MAG: M48 family metallopeptidase [Veillonellaceae bacterium]|nr:M48 family metallopeptidase [Veillonellaceae bacterium]